MPDSSTTAPSGDGRAGLLGPDPLDHPDPLRAGDAAATETLLRAYVRETGVPVPPPGGTLRAELPSSHLALDIPVRYRSPSGWHRFGEPRLSGTAHPSGGDGGVPGPGTGAPPGEDGDPAGSVADAALVAAALIRETTTGQGLPAHRGADAVGRVLGSARRTTVHLAYRRAEARTVTAPSPFLDAEQALLVGHPFHPAPKSREEASEAELAAYSPELRGSFPLHWFAADPSIVVGDSADPGRPVERLLAALAPGLDLPPGTVPVPAHPWQAREVLGRPAVARLVDRGLLRPLGAAGPAWFPTSSLRTVHRPDAEVMLKLSLGMRITNSRRNNLRGEMRLGVRAARLLQRGPGAWLRAEHPSFRILRDFAWVSVGTGAGEGEPGPEETGLETALRDNPFRGGAGDALCVAGLVAERTGPGDGSAPRHRALLCSVVERAARHLRLSTQDAALRWFGEYLSVLAVPLIRLRARYGLALEAHQQNTLVGLDGDGLPSAGWYRDSQGYYIAASHAGEARRLLPGIGEGVHLIFDDALVDQRLAYYLVVNNLLGLVGAFGALGLADEHRLLRVFRVRLDTLRATEPGAAGLLDLLLDSPTLPCKGNYLTCVDGRDELVGDVLTQSVYIDLPNPLAEVSR